MADQSDPHEIDLDDLHRVLEEYPWLLPLLREAHWYSRPDGGGGGFHVDVDNLEPRLDGLRALAAATGLAFEVRPLAP